MSKPPRPESDVVDVTKWTHERLEWHLRICCDDRLRDRAKLLASLLLHDFDLRKGGCAWRGQEGEGSLSARAGWKDPKTVALAAQELEAAGYLRIERGRGRGKSNRYFPVFEAADASVDQAGAEPEDGPEKGDARPPFEGAEKGDPHPPFSAEKGDVGPIKGGCTSPLLRKESSKTLSAMRAREASFDRMVEACPARMLEFVDLPAASDAFEAICDGGEDPDAFGPALQRFAASEGYQTRKHPPQLHDWLRKGMWRVWLRGDGAETPPAAAAGPVTPAPFDGPAEVAAALRELGGREVEKWLVGATWREAGRTIETRTGYGRDELVRLCGARSLREMAIKVERRGER